jgi:plastocyanin
MKALALAAALLGVVALSGLSTLRAQEAAAVQISVKDHRFDPAEIKAPAGKPFTLRVKNLDATPMEFESQALRVEKVIAGNGEATINVRAQKAGRYDFFDDFNRKAHGVLVVE